MVADSAPAEPPDEEGDDETGDDRADDAEALAADLEPDPPAPS
jgi:hypothetical protein